MGTHVGSYNFKTRSQSVSEKSPLSPPGRLIISHKSGMPLKAIPKGLCPPAQGCDPALSDNPSPLIQPKCLQCATAVLIPLPRKSGGATLGNRANRVSTPPLRRRGGVVAALDTLGHNSDGVGSHWRGVPRSRYSLKKLSISRSIS